MIQNIEELPIAGLKIIQPRIYSDHRGKFFESYNTKTFAEAVGNFQFVQDNISYSTQNIIRGLHYQAPPYGQGKLVTVLKGEVLDVAVDIRKNSPTFGQYQTVLLSDKNHLFFWIPEGFAHGFSVLSDDCIFSYKCTQFYNKDSERGIHWADPQLSIDWRIDHVNAILSEKDVLLPYFEKLTEKDFFY